MGIEGKARSIGPLQRFSRCMICKFPIFVRMSVLQDDRLKVLAYNYFNNRRHRCYIDPTTITTRQRIPVDRFV